MKDFIQTGIDILYTDLKLPVGKYEIQVRHEFSVPSDYEEGTETDYDIQKYLDRIANE